MKELRLLMTFGLVLPLFLMGKVQGEPVFDDLVFPDSTPYIPSQSADLRNPAYSTYWPYGAPQGNPSLQLPYNLSSSLNRYNIYPYGWSLKPNKKSWGDTRYIWPDVYTDFTRDAWDKMINTPYDLGYLPGGWRFPSFSSPDPVTVGDAIANQVPPIVEEIPNFMNFTD